MKIHTKKPIRKNLLRAAARKAFSLVELLVVIAVIGIIAAIAIPNIAGITDSAKTAQYKRNAQNVASVSSAASAAGYGFAQATGTLALVDLRAGVVGPDVPGSNFTVDIKDDDYTNAKTYLNYATGKGFTYAPNADGTAN